MSTDISSLKEIFAVTLPQAGGLPEYAGPLLGATMMPRGRLRMRADWVRTEREEGDIQKVAASIKILRAAREGIGGTGIIQRLSVSWDAGAFLPDGSLRPDAVCLIHGGDTRFMASEIAGFKDTDLLPVEISDLGTDAARRSGFFENFFRNDMSPLDTAIELARWRKGFEPPLTQARAAKILGVGPSVIQNYTDVLGVDDDVKDVVLTNRKSVDIARRINAVRDDKLRQELIAVAKQPKSALRVRKLLAQAKGKTHGGSTNSEQTRFGTPAAKGTTPMPRVELVGALSSLNRYADDALDALRGVKGRVPADVRRKMLAELEALEEKSASFRELLEEGSGAKK